MGLIRREVHISNKKRYLWIDTFFVDCSLLSASFFVEITGLEPVTSTLPVLRSSQMS